jgi:predicted NAD-dependent protein-ADP-ribosyltransferase YbiA (DUF1768 family)
VFQLFNGLKEPLSSFAFGGFWYKDRRHASLEHAIACARADFNGQPHVARLVAAERLPTSLRGILRAHSVSNYAIWRPELERLLPEVIMAKLKVNEAMRAELESTGDDYIALATSFDKLQGTGLDLYDPGAFDREMWGGENLYGEVKWPDHRRVAPNGLTPTAPLSRPWRRRVHRCGSGSSTRRR